MLLILSAPAKLEVPGYLDLLRMSAMARELKDTKQHVAEVFSTCLPKEPHVILRTDTPEYLTVLHATWHVATEGGKSRRSREVTLQIGKPATLRFAEATDDELKELDRRLQDIVHKRLASDFGDEDSGEPFLIVIYAADLDV